MQGQELRRAADRTASRVTGGVLHHAFAAGAHYDPANTSFGALVLHDEVLLEPGAGFPEHAHAGVVVVTHVLTGSLRHRDAHGADVLLGPSDTGVMAAGRGLVHAEHAGPDGCRYLQAFLLDGAAAPHAVHRGADQVRCAGSVMLVLRVSAGEQRTVPGGRVHVHVVDGVLEVGGDRLAAGDALRAPGQVVVRAAAPATAVCWALPG